MIDGGTAPGVVVVVGPTVVDVVEVVDVEIVVLLDDDVVELAAVEVAVIEVEVEIDVEPVSGGGCDELLSDPDVHDISNGAAIGERAPPRATAHTRPAISSA